MLISRRKEGEALHIGDDVEIRIISVKKRKVILGVMAPHEVKITTTRLSEAELENTKAAANVLDLSDLTGSSSEQESVLFLLKRSTNNLEDPQILPIRHMETQDE